MPIRIWNNLPSWLPRVTNCNKSTSGRNTKFPQLRIDKITMAVCIYWSSEVWCLHIIYFNPCVLEEDADLLTSLFLQTMTACWHWRVTAPTMTTRCLMSSFICFFCFATTTTITVLLLVDGHGWIPHKWVSTARANAVEVPIYSVTAHIYIIIKYQNVYTNK